MKLPRIASLTLCSMVCVLTITLPARAEPVACKRAIAKSTAKFVQAKLQALQTWTFRQAATFILIIGVGLVFYCIPNAKTRFRDVWVGAALTGLLWRLAFNGFSWYISSNTRLAYIQGSLTAVVGFLLWIYVSSVIRMYGVEFTAAYARLRRHRSDEMPAAPTPRV